MATSRTVSADMRRQVGTSPRPKGRGKYPDNGKESGTPWTLSPYASASAVAGPGFGLAAPVPNGQSAKPFQSRTSSSDSRGGGLPKGQDALTLQRHPRRFTENKDTPCRNITIYGHCRYINTCTFNHDQAGLDLTHLPQPDFGRKTLNGESPSFTPASLQSLAPQAPKKATSLSVKAASAAPFTPRATSSTPVVQEPETAAPFNPAVIREFTPQFDMASQTTSNSTGSDPIHFDHFAAAMPPVGHGIQPQYNPYADDQNGMGGHGAGFYTNPASFASEGQPLQYHLYYPTGTRRQDLLAHQRAAHDFFIPEKLREELHKRAEASRQVLNSGLPQLDNYHSLVALDTSSRKAHNVLGYSSWVYKATSSKTGHMYCLRRLEGFRLSSEETIRCVKTWKRVNHASIVTVWDAFTTRAFGDSSLIFVMDYHPLSKTLAEFHNLQTLQSISPSHGVGYGHRQSGKQSIPENTLWNYISQISSALKAIHDQGLAARCIDATKIIVTDKQRIRLNACSILDVVNFDARRPVQDLQQEDLTAFGRLILHLATDTPLTPYSNLQASVDVLSRYYSNELRDTVMWLLTPHQPSSNARSIDDFIRGIALHMVATMDQAFQSHDTLTDNLQRELENGRVARLVMKLATIAERNEHEGERAWSETGERYILKLFRDYVFHQNDAQGHPVVDIGHMLRCVNKLDAGTEEQVCLTSRDENNSIVISYKELKKHMAAAFGELCKGGSITARPGRRNA
jgi:PAB-dependent poly(A)-specific ribonuclease subunit 3